MDCNPSHASHACVKIVGQQGLNDLRSAHGALRLDCPGANINSCKVCSTAQKESWFAFKGQ